MNAHDVVMEALEILGLKSAENEEAYKSETDSFAFRFDMARGGILRIFYDGKGEGVQLEAIMKPSGEKSEVVLRELLLKANFVLINKGFVFSINPLTSEIYLRRCTPFSIYQTQASLAEKGSELAESFTTLAGLTLAWIEFIQTMHLHAPDVAQDSKILRQLTEIDETFLRI